MGRPGVKHVKNPNNNSKSPRQFAQDHLIEANHLEARLAQYRDKMQKTGSTAASADVNKIRAPLCQRFSEILLSDARVAIENDVWGRLWRGCFYSNIAPLRAHILKERKKRSASATPTNDERMLAHFLQEALGLYNYIADKLEQRVVTGGAVDDGMSMASSSATSSQVPLSAASLDGVVHLLHLLNISIGDLHRYDVNLSDAEAAYQLSAHLGPGHGHPYNQIAVVCQMRSDPQSVVALYWYARSLLSTCEPFPTSKSNLKRLFDDNRKWLETNSHSHNGASGQAKAAVTKRVLSEFVDLHGVFFHGLSKSSAERSTGEMAIYKKMDLSLEGIQSLLQASALGDALLCKLIVIQVFAERWFSDDRITNERTQYVARTYTYQLASRLADRVLLSLSKISGKKIPSSVRWLMPLLLVVEYLEEDWPQQASLDSMERQDTFYHEDARLTLVKKLVEIFNLLKPIAMSMPESSGDAEELKEYKQLRGFAPFARFLDVIPEDGFLTADQAVTVLQGNTPRKSQSEGPTQDTAASTHASSSATNNSASAGRVKIARMMTLSLRLAESSSSKLAQLIQVTAQGKFAVLDTVVEDEDNEAGDVMLDDNEGAILETSPRKTAIMFDEGGPQPPAETAAGDDAGMLVYQQSASGGPALLVPGALLQQRQQQTSPAAPTGRGNDAISITVATEQLNLGGPTNPSTGVFATAGPATPSSLPSTSPMPNLAPPPGFGGVASPGAAAGAAPSTTTSTSLGNGGVALTSHFLFPSQSTKSGGQQTMANVLQAMVPPPTDNPFANMFDQQIPSTSNPSALVGNPVNPPIGLIGGNPNFFGPLSVADSLTSNFGNNKSFVPPGMGLGPTIGGSVTNTVNNNNNGSSTAGDGMNVEGAPLLDSSLLQSLWMEESRSAPPPTRNPFAL